MSSLQNCKPGPCWSMCRASFGPDWGRTSRKKKKQPNCQGVCADSALWTGQERNLCLCHSPFIPSWIIMNQTHEPPTVNMESFVIYGCIWWCWTTPHKVRWYPAIFIQDSGLTPNGVGIFRICDLTWTWAQTLRIKILSSPRNTAEQKPQHFPRCARSSWQWGKVFLQLL